MSEKVLNVLDCKTAFAVPGQDSVIDMINPFTSKSWYYNETLEQIRLRYPGAEIVEFEDWLKAKADRQHTPIVWLDSTEEQWWEMLEVLPPAAMNRGGFLVGEPMDHDASNGQPRFSAYRQWGKKFYVANRPMTIKEFKAEIHRLTE